MVRMVYRPEVTGRDTSGPQRVPPVTSLRHTAPCFQLLGRVDRSRDITHLPCGDGATRPHRRVQRHFVRPTKERAAGAPFRSRALGKRAGTARLCANVEVAADIRGVAPLHRPAKCWPPVDATRRLGTPVGFRDGGNVYVSQHLDHHVANARGLHGLLRHPELLRSSRTDNQAEQAQRWVLPNHRRSRTAKHFQEPIGHRGVG